MQFSPDTTESSESDNDDIESVDWAAPLDITSILYKPKYVIRPDSGKARPYPTKSANSDDQFRSSSTLYLPATREESKSTDFADANVPNEAVEIVDNKGKKNSGMRLFRRDTSNYAVLIKALQEEIRDMSRETKRLEDHSFYTVR